MAIQIIPAGATSKTVLKPGQAVIAVQATAAGSGIRELSSAYPVKVISPRSSHDRRAVLAFLLSYGGGVVPGDKVALRVHVDRGCRLGLLTQGSTKLYKSLDPNLVSAQTLTATVEDGAALLMLPDPLQPFRDSVYEQRQVFRVHRSANLLLLDWISEGRRAMGETWDLTSLKSMNEVWRFDDVVAPGKAKPRLMIRDNVLLYGSRRPALVDDCVRQHVGGMGIFGTLIVGGPIFENLCHFFLGEFAALPRVGEINWATDNDVKKAADDGDDIVWSAAATRGYTVVKFGAQDVDRARRWLRDMLEREGTVAREFGSRFLLCLQDR
ncbi:hypothetical protein LMH87_006065 [Akanthomyces muscarius]|uniref:Urease accessory protein UreD n=1 Tax=Akanthomyces muscarius TaxID=2231603 RepID=A0A9W8QQ24_AKAMU|nr:hypothetical protein LMH87_006065 [Akanthomyces muscarius]KAJ4164389.1 hypothetical protein LMH87_006065 [Akanthomyces muscarius]